ncbi:DUF4861 domain-containing protein [Zobellia amurskyensis]|uniref:DUF4861 domain-containing protein n=1 Tax=Zobellia amurskyensis TaxID=248905 RepID=A0A7X3D2G9_9FLAO|nr:DUF4861 domain-containing protein [Zobellia amurskyensis]MUH36558.1 DUF4861 domain-containing protein [Zobellia amurskyensis]
MKRKVLVAIGVYGALVHLGCADAAQEIYQVEIENPLNESRSFETVEIDLHAVPFKQGILASAKSYELIDSSTKAKITSQAVDNDGDGRFDQLLFQPNIEAKATKIFEIVPSEEIVEVENNPACYSRFVPERTDDYAWENNRVAFRTYGPTAQKLKEDGIPGGTLSSGIDAWLKKVDYPIINKWYKKELETDGTYHEDTGEGLDNFHVGVSRGVGGIAVKKDSTHHISKNFESYKRVTIGPIRTSFVLKYADWNAGEDIITEEKHISLDYGSNLSRLKIKVKGTDHISAGLTMHENDGETSVNKSKGYISYWQPHEESELGTAIVSNPKTLLQVEEYQNGKPDENNVYAQLKVENGTVDYYAGFTWKESGQFSNAKEWENYLAEFSKKLRFPLQISYLK